MAEEERTIDLYSRSATLSSSSSSQALKKKASGFMPKFSQLGSFVEQPQEDRLGSQSGETIVISGSTNKKKPANIQTLDEIFDELVQISPSKSKPPSGRRKEKEFEREYDSNSDSEEEKSNSPSKMKLSALGNKSVSWLGGRSTSPPLSISTSGSKETSTERTSFETHSSALKTGTGQPTQGLKKMTRCMSEIISLTDPKAAALPYNIKSKKKVARRIQSIHHIVGPADKDEIVQQMESSSQRSRTESEASGASIPPRHSIGTGTDDDMTMTTTNSESGNDNDSIANLSTSSNKSKVKYVPVRMHEEGNPDLTRLMGKLTVNEQIRLATLLSSQEATHGFNMFDALIPGDKEEINRMMMNGTRYEDAALLIFEKRYVTKAGEELSSRLSHSAPTSPNISYDYSSNPYGIGVPNYSEDYAYTVPAMSGQYSPYHSPHAHSHSLSYSASYYSPNTTMTSPSPTMPFSPSHAHSQYSPSHLQGLPPRPPSSPSMSYYYPPTSPHSALPHCRSAMNFGVSSSHPSSQLTSRTNSRGVSREHSPAVRSRLG